MAQSKNVITLKYINGELIYQKFNSLNQAVAAIAPECKKDRKQIKGHIKASIAAGKTYYGYRFIIWDN